MSSEEDSKGDVIEHGKTVGTAYKLDEFWVVNTYAVDISPEGFKEANLFTARTATLELAGALRAKVEGSFAEIYLANLVLEATTPLAATVVLGPGPSISLDVVKGKMVTNSVYINSKTNIELSTMRQRNTVAEVRNVLSKVATAAIAFNSADFKIGVAQRAFMSA